MPHPWKILSGKNPDLLRNAASFPLIRSIRLTAINAAQLALALVANLFLLFNMAKRVRFAVAQPITIIGW